jgi:colicin import membrane protein
MDWKQKMDELKGQADSVMKKAEAHYAELKGRLDRDGDGVPDAVESAMARAREAAAAAKAKLVDFKANLDKDGDGTPDVLHKLSEQAHHAIEQARAKAAELAQAASDRLSRKPPTGA